ncbi:MAG: hypothetical protein H7A36_04355 [Chlamydiales bacterium]|nr:hypothetical protein [Chlamydiales bacterium]
MSFNLNLKLWLSLFFSFLICTPSTYSYLTPPPATYRSTEPSNYAPFSPKVNVITGEYCDEECDLVAPGIEPLSFRRFYNHLGHLNLAHGHWRVNPESLVLFNLAKNENNFTGIGDERGGFLICESETSSGFQFNPNKHTNYTNSGSGQHHPFNVNFTVNKHRPKKKEFFWQGDVTDGTGRKRTFQSEIGMWKEENFAPVYQARSLIEHLPNGNYIVYKFTDVNNHNDHRNKRLDTYYILESIRAYSSDNTPINELSFSYQRRGKKHDYCIEETFVTDQGKRTAHLHHHIPTVREYNRRRGHEFEFDVLLNTVYAPGKPTQVYSYRHDEAKHYFKHPFLRTVSSRGGCLLTNYDWNSKKVTSQCAPLGPNGDLVPIAQYLYSPNHTRVLDAEDNKTIYRFDKDKRITAIERYDQDTLLQVERNRWDSKTGNLLSFTIENGKGKVYRNVTYKYDSHQNVSEETIDGYTLYRSYDPKFNVIIKEWDNYGKKILYNYKKDTNLLESELTCEGDRIRKRVFHDYDASAVCTRTIIDDGQSLDKEDLLGVTFRQISQVKPKQSFPCFGLPEEITKPDGCIVRYTYHPSGQIEKEEHFDCNGSFCYALTNEYDEQERLLSSTNALGYQTTYTYDQNFNLTSIANDKQTILLEYDKANRLTSEIVGSFTTTFSYDRLSRLTAKKDPYGITRYTYDPLGNLTSITYPDGGIELREYDPLGNITKQTDPMGYITTTTYNQRSQPLHIIHPNGIEESFTYNPNGTLASHTTVNGPQKYTYDIFGNIVKTVDGDRVTSATYSPFHKLSETDAMGITTHYTYDKTGRLLTQQCEEQITSYEYDSLGRQYRIHQDDETTTLSFDYKDQLIEKRINDCFKEGYTYDSFGNRTEVITCLGTSKTEYNENNLPIKEIEPCGNITTYEYSYDTTVTRKITNPKGVITQEKYDPCARLVFQQTAEQVREKKYDLNGNLIEATENGVSHTWKYGPSNRLEQFVEAASKETNYLYDKMGRLQTTIKPDSTKLHRLYDSHGRLARYYGPDFDYTYSYNHNNHILQAGETKRTYDSYGNTIEEKLANGISIRRSYTPHGKKASLYLPDNTVVYYTYRGPFLSRVSYQEYTHCYKRNLSGDPIQSQDTRITYDRNHRWKSFASPHFQANYDYDCCGNLLSDGTNSYTYDTLNRLISENGHTYAYDATHNRIQKDAQTCSFNTLCQNKAFIYDRNGNLISDGKHTYTYDSLDRLIAFDEHRYTYDAFNRRMTRDETPFIWDDKQEIGTPFELRILGEGKGAEIGASILLKLHGTCYIPTHDHRGCLVALSDLNGNLVEDYKYTAFGEELTGHTLSPWRFASKRHDEDLVYFGRRYYSPSQGRWITPDPIGFSDGPNLYAYVNNKPHTLMDLHGLFCMPFRGSGMRSFFKGAKDHAWNIGTGIAQSMGSWTIADMGYEITDDPTLFHSKSQEALNGWQQLGEAFLEHPFRTAGELLMPGVMQITRDPRNPEAWGAAAFDVGLLALSTYRGVKISSSIRKSDLRAKSLSQFSGSVKPSGFLGKRGWELQNASFQKVRNSPAKISGLQYSGHALDQMQNRGILPSVVENTVKQGTYSHDPIKPRVRYFEAGNHITIITERDRVITVIRGER